MVTALSCASRLQKWFLPPGIPYSICPDEMAMIFGWYSLYSHGNQMSDLNFISNISCAAIEMNENIFEYYVIWNEIFQQTNCVRRNAKLNESRKIPSNKIGN